MSGNLNAGEDGQPLRYGIGEDATGETPSLIFIKPDLTVITKEAVDGVAVGLVDFTSEDGKTTLLAGQYLLYNVEPGLLDEAGTWEWKAKVIFASPLKTAMTDFKPLLVAR